MNNKNYSEKDTVPFKVNPFKINSSRKEKKKKETSSSIFSHPHFSRPVRSKIRWKGEKKGAGGNQKLEALVPKNLSHTWIYLDAAVQSQTTKRIIVGARSECVTALVGGMPCSVATWSVNDDAARTEVDNLNV